MDPHERTRRPPIIDGIALRKPRCSATVMCLAGNIVVYPRVWGGQPTAKLLLELVIYVVVSIYTPRNGNIKRLRTF